MIEPLYRASAFTVYQATLVFGIAILPLALLARRLGVNLPVGDLVTAAGRAYENAK